MEALTVKHVLYTFHVIVAVAFAKFLSEVVKSVEVRRENDALLNGLRVKNLSQVKLPVSEHTKLLIIQLSINVRVQLFLY